MVLCYCAFICNCSAMDLCMLLAFQHCPLLGTGCHKKHSLKEEHDKAQGISEILTSCLLSDPSSSPHGLSAGWTQPPPQGEYLFLPRHGYWLHHPPTYYSSLDFSIVWSSCSLCYLPVKLGHAHSWKAQRTVLRCPLEDSWQLLQARPGNKRRLQQVQRWKAFRSFIKVTVVLSKQSD